MRPGDPQPHHTQSYFYEMYVSDQPNDRGHGRFEHVFLPIIFSTSPKSATTAVFIYKTMFAHTLAAVVGEVGFRKKF